MKTIDGANIHAISEFALNAIFGHYESHLYGFLNQVCKLLGDGTSTPHRLPTMRIMESGLCGGILHGHGAYFQKPMPLISEKILLG
ncbi:MAG: hypothetical protein ACOYMG_07650, partial [Candidatus Methylumidiphilus sp.]